MATPARKWLTAKEYLEIERAADTKSQFFAGEMFAMAGASLAHNLITANVLIAQDRPHLERYVRQPEGGQWLLTESSDPEGRVPREAIGCELALAEIYAKVQLPEDENPLRRCSAAG